VRFAVFLYSRKLIVIRAGSTEPREPVNEARTPRVLRGFSPHLVADDDIINDCCGRITRDRGPLDSSARRVSAPRSTHHRHLVFRLHRCASRTRTTAHSPSRSMSTSIRPPGRV
jgi:hypothetical protein